MEEDGFEDTYMQSKENQNTTIPIGTPIPDEETIIEKNNSTPQASSDEVTRVKNDNGRIFVLISYLLNGSI